MSAIPRQHTSPNPYASTFSPMGGGPGRSGSIAGSSVIGGTSSSAYGWPGSGGVGVGAAPSASRMVKRLFKFPQMDFEVAVWEMTQLMVAPKKVFRQVYYRKQTRNTYTSGDPAFTYLLSFFLLLTSFAWSLAYASPSFLNIIRIAFWFVFVQCLASSLGFATIIWAFVDKLIGPGGWLVKGIGRRRGLFGVQDAGGGGEDVEWGFCFDVSIRAFLPIWVHLYVLQFFLLPAVATRTWASTLLSNTLHLLAYSQAAYIAFLGLNSLPSLSAAHVLLAVALAAFGISWLVLTVSGWNASLHLAPILWCAGGLRKVVGGLGG